MTLPEGPERDSLIANGLQFQSMPLSVQEELQLNQKLMLTQ
jgi:hypothetical protein